MATPPTPPHDDDNFELQLLFSRLVRGLPSILALAVLGVAVGLGSALVMRTGRAPTTTLFLSIGFDTQAAQARYPDESLFQPDDIRAAPLVQEALQRVGEPNSPEAVALFQNALGVSGVISSVAVREREKLRAAGQVLPPYFPTEFELSYTARSGATLTDEQARRLLTEIANLYRDRYRQMSRRLPEEFGAAFTALESVEYQDFGTYLGPHLEALKSYLARRGIKPDATYQPLFRAIDTFLSVRLPLFLETVDTARLARNPAVTEDRARAELLLLSRREQDLEMEDEVVAGLLDRVHPSTRANADSTAEDTLVQRAIANRLALKRLRAQKALLLKYLDATPASVNRTDLAASAVTELRSAYDALIARAREAVTASEGKNPAAVTITQPASTPPARNPAYAASIGFLSGLLLGIGLSLLDLHPLRKRA